MWGQAEENAFLNRNQSERCCSYPHEKKSKLTKAMTRQLET